MKKETETFQYNFSPINTSLRKLDDLLGRNDGNVERLKNIYVGLSIVYTSFTSRLASGGNKPKEYYKRENVFYKKSTEPTKSTLEIMAMSNNLSNFCSILEKIKENPERRKLFEEEVRDFSNQIYASDMFPYMVEALKYPKKRPFAFVSRIMLEKDERGDAHIDASSNRYWEIGRYARLLMANMNKNIKYRKDKVDIREHGERKILKVEREKVQQALRKVLKEKLALNYN